MDKWTLNTFRKKSFSFSQYALLATFFLLPISTSLGNIFYLLSFVLLLLHSPKKMFFLASCNKISYLFWGFALLIIISIFYSKAPFIVALVTAKKNIWLLLMPFFFSLFNSKKMITSAQRCFLAAMLITLALSYLKIFGLLHLTSNFTNASVFKDHIIQGFLMVFAACIILSNINKNSKYRFIYAIITLLILINVLCLAHGRFAYFLVLLLILLWCLSYFTLKKAVVVFSFCLVIIIIAFFSSNTLNAQMHRTFKSIHLYLKHDQAGPEHPASNTSFAIRINEAKVCLEHINTKNIFQGLGSGSISAIFANSKIEKKSPQEHTLIDSGYINMLMQRGLAGILYFIFFIVILWREFSLLPKNYKLQGQFFLLSLTLGLFLNTWLTEVTISHLFSVFVILYLSINKIGVAQHE